MHFKIPGLKGWSSNPNTLTGLPAPPWLCSYKCFLFPSIHEMAVTFFFFLLSSIKIGTNAINIFFPQWKIDLFVLQGKNLCVRIWCTLGKHLQYPVGCRYYVGCRYLPYKTMWKVLEEVVSWRECCGWYQTSLLNFLHLVFFFFQSCLMLCNLFFPCVYVD